MGGLTYVLPCGYNIAHEKITKGDSMSTNQDAIVRARINKKTKTQAEKVMKKMGLSTSEAIRIFFDQIITDKRLPFELCVPSPTTLRALQEDISKAKRYKSLDAMWKDLGIDIKGIRKNKS